MTWLGEQLEPVLGQRGLQLLARLHMAIPDRW